jgi:hypothetical protein
MEGGVSTQDSLRLDLLGTPSGRNRALVFPAKVEIVVIDGEGVTLGTEAITILRRTGEYYLPD